MTLQKKCVINYKQQFSKEELFFLNNHNLIMENKELFINPEVKINDFNEVNKFYIGVSHISHPTRVMMLRRGRVGTE